jgi:hypothetical protein
LIPINTPAAEDCTLESMRTQACANQCMDFKGLYLQSLHQQTSIARLCFHRLPWWIPAMLVFKGVFALPVSWLPLLIMIGGPGPSISAVTLTHALDGMEGGNHVRGAVVHSLPDRLVNPVHVDV